MNPLRLSSFAPMIVTVVMCAVPMLTTTIHAADSATKAARPAIYDEQADATKQIAEALTRAKANHQHVLLQFGANWCGWCHRLHQLFASDAKIAARLKADYVVVLVDVNKDHNAATNQRYGNPMQFGLPVLVVLDADGKQLTTQDTGKLEEGDHHDPAKVLAFLERWAPQPAPAAKP